MTIRPLLSWLLLVLLVAGLHQAAAAEVQPVPVAIADFDNFDTTGEDAQRTAEHAERVKMFADLLRSDLSADGRYRIVELSCPGFPCLAAKTRPADFLKAARATGARLLVYGGVHKQSTLVQWALVHAVDLERDKLVLERTFSLRGDTDEAFRRAAEFITEYLRQLRSAP
jgi:hypothetical protein